MPRPKRLLRALLGRDRSDEQNGRQARAAFWESARSMTPYVAVERGEAAFILPTLIDPKLFVNAGRSDFDVLERACAILREAGRLEGKDTFVDIGAHIGTTTVSALLERGFARAVAVEPDPDHLPLLRANIALNGLHDRVTVIAAGVSDSAGEQLFASGSRKEGAYRWMKGRLADEPSPTTTAVTTVALDDLAEDGVVDPAAAGLLWLDCSRCEEDAFRSASAFLEQRVPIVFVLRRNQLTESSRFLRQLDEVYEQVVDLRHPSLAEPVSTWTPEFRPVAGLIELPERKKLTDVLVF